jgi:hypothetical protein
MIIQRTEKIFTNKIEVYPRDLRGARVRRVRYWFLFLPVYTSFEILEIQ